MKKTKEKTTFATLNAIATHTTFHRNTISKWFSLPDAPKRGPKGYDFDQVIEWIKQCADRERSIGKTNPTVAAAKLEEILQRVERLKRKNALEAGKLVSSEWVRDRNRNLAERFKELLYGKLVDELPADLSNDVATNRALLRNVADRLLGEVGSWAKTWTPPTQ